MSDDVLPKSLEAAFELMRKHNARLGTEDQFAAAIARAEAAEAALDKARSETWAAAIEAAAVAALPADPFAGWVGSFYEVALRSAQARIRALAKIAELKGGAQ